MNKLSSLLILILLIISCEPNTELSISENSIKISKFENETSLQFKDYMEYNSITPLNYHLSDTSLILMDISQKSNDVIHEINLQNKKLTKTYFKLGSGPGELISPISSGLYNNLLWIYDLTSNKIIQANINDKTINLNDFSIKSRFTWVDRLDSITFVANGNRENTTKLQFINISTGKVIDSLGEYHNVPDRFNTELIKSFYQSLIFLKPDKKKLVCLYRFTDSIEIFNLKKKTSTVISGPKNIKVVYEELKSGDLSFMNMTDETIQTFIYGSVTDNYIYALYSGGSAMETSSQIANTLYVYDWDGNPMKKIDLDTKIMSFKVSKNDSTLYSYDIDRGVILYAEL